MARRREEPRPAQLGARPPRDRRQHHAHQTQRVRLVRRAARPLGLARRRRPARHGRVRRHRVRRAGRSPAADPGHQPALPGRRLGPRPARPHPVPAARARSDNTWSDNLLAQQRYLRTSATAEKEVYLGVEIAPRSRITALLDSRHGQGRQPRAGPPRPGRRADRRGRRLPRHRRPPGRRAPDGVAAAPLGRARPAGAGRADVAARAVRGLGDERPARVHRGRRGPPDPARPVRADDRPPPRPRPAHLVRRGGDAGPDAGAGGPGPARSLAVGDRRAAVPGRGLLDGRRAGRHRDPRRRDQGAAAHPRPAAAVPDPRRRRAGRADPAGRARPAHRGRDEPRRRPGLHPHRGLVPAGRRRAQRGRVHGAGPRGARPLQAPAHGRGADQGPGRAGARVRAGRADRLQRVPPAAADALLRRRPAAGGDPARRPPRTADRDHRVERAAAGHVRHALLDRGEEGLRAGADRRPAGRRQVRARGGDLLPGRPARDPYGHARPVRPAGRAGRDAGAAGVRRAHRPGQGAGRHALAVGGGAGAAAGPLRLPGAVRRGDGRGPRRAQDAGHRHRPDAAAGPDRPQPAHRAAAAAGDPRGRRRADQQLLGGHLAAAGVRGAAVRRRPDGPGRRGLQAAAGRVRGDARADPRRPALGHRGDPAGPAVLPAADPAGAGARRPAAAHRGRADRDHDERAGAAEPDACRGSTGRSPSG